MTPISEWVGNRAFDQLAAQRPENHSLPERVAEIVDSGFAESGGCLYIQALRDQDVDHDRVSDATGLEALVNHFHIHPEGKGPDDFWSALGAAERLAGVLRGYPAAGPTRVIVSRDVEEHPNSIARIIRRREREPWLAEDLESYAGPVGYVDVDP